MSRHLDDEDLEIIGIFLEERILSEVRKLDHRLETSMTALSDEITRLQADDEEIKADVTAVQSVLAANAAAIAALQAQIASGDLPPDQQAALEAVASDLETAHAAFVAAVPPAPSPEPAPGA